MITDVYPYPTLKDSGLQWMGRIPTHWDVQRLKTICSMESGSSITANEIGLTGRHPVYGGNGLRGFTGKYTHEGTFPLVGRQGALCGNVHIARGKFRASEHAVVATTHSGHIPEWLGLVLKITNLNQYSMAAAQPGLSVDRLLDIRLPVPPVSEQAAIVHYVEYADQRIQRYIRAKQKLIALLGEQKQTIIHQAVTGRMDIRTRQPDAVYTRSGVSLAG